MKNNYGLLYIYENFYKNMEIKHTNGNAIYIRLKQETKDEIEKRWIVPTDEPYLYIDKYNRPFVQRPNDLKTLCTVRKETLIDGGFHL